MRIFTAAEIDKVLNHQYLVKALKKGFREECLIPDRTHLDYQSGENENTLLTMPAIGAQWGGVKLVNVAPDNATEGIETIQGVYYLFETKTGIPKAILDAKSLTNWRTAAASALASSFLSREDSKVLTMIGTGSLAPFLINAHASVRPIKQVRVWGRNVEKAEKLAISMATNFQKVDVFDSIEKAIEGADIVSAATLAEEPLIEGHMLTAGQHVDLVGSFKPTSREADDEVIKRSSIYIDTEACLRESGDLYIPLTNDVIDHRAIKGTLFSLCKEDHFRRTSSKEITLFKSVGYALEDLVAAELIWKQSK